MHPVNRTSANSSSRSLAIVWLTGIAAVMLSACASVPDCSLTALPVSSAELTLTHADGRKARFTLWQPERAGSYPMMVFSHGAYAAPERYDALLGPLAAMGFVVAAPLHIDSELIATDPPPPPDQVWRTRKEDFARLLEGPPELLEALGRGVSLSDEKIAAGHSYGAFGAQVAAGAAAVGDEPGRVEPGVKAVLAFSPPGLLPGFIEPDAWDQLSRPQLLLTGTSDILPGFIDDWRAHAAAYRQAPAGDQWLWAGEGVDHYFGNVFGRLDREAPDQRPQFDEALAVSQRFLAAYTAQPLAVCSDPLSTGSTVLASLEKR
ncbi:MAG: hypothetical protein AAF736_15620 [Pseudomonadota bacterium]